MGGAQFLVEGALVLLLGATLYHAMRLERALGVLKRDRAVLEGLVTGFNDSTRQAEEGVAHLVAATEGAGRLIARQIEQAQRLRDDLTFLSERGERLAERLESGGEGVAHGGGPRRDGRARRHLRAGGAERRAGWFRRRGGAGGRGAVAQRGGAGPAARAAGGTLRCVANSRARACCRRQSSSWRCCCQ
ncbi:MAG: DUF6468 domain-containing protein [Rhodospirillales bacterium]